MIEEFARLYFDHGMSTREIGARYGIGKWVVQKALKQAGYTLRPGKAPKGPQKRVDLREEARFRQMAQEGSRRLLERIVEVYGRAA